MRADSVPVVHSDPEILGGTPVFVGTRVPVQNLIDHLDAGDSVEDFLRSFPTVDRKLVIAYLTSEATHHCSSWKLRSGAEAADV
jgi:uncharacterized protein (DUF433 family)